MSTALIVDDEALVREAVLRLGHWADFGIDVIWEAATVTEALAIIAAHAPHILITDMKMPERDGIQLLQELENPEHVWKRIPQILVISGFYDYQYTRQAIHSKVVDYILKPIDPRDLNQALAAAAANIEAEREESSGGAETVLIPHKTIHEIEQFIRGHFAEGITLEELSRKFYVCKEHISRSFKKEFQVNLFEYLNRLRIDKARELLLQTPLTIEEIALRVGFGDGNYFGKAFKKVMNISPSEYRNNLERRK